MSRGRRALMVALILALAAFAARAGVREMQVHNKRRLAADLVVIAEALQSHRLTLKDAASLRRRPAYVSLGGNGTRSPSEIVLIYRYEVRGFLNSPMVVSLVVSLAAHGDAFAVTGAYVDQPFD